MEVQQETQGNVRCRIVAEETEIDSHEEYLHAKEKQGYRLEEEIGKKTSTRLAGRGTSWLNFAP